MGKPDRAAEAGLTLVMAEREDGSWSYELRNEAGDLISTKDGYREEQFAHRAASRWITEHYEEAPVHEGAREGQGQGQILLV